MGIKLHQAGYDHAMSLLKAGKVDKEASWDFSAEDGNAMLGEAGDNWKAYAGWHLGHREGADEKTKECWAYPFGKGGKVYRSALTAIRQRAGQQNDTAVFEAAGKLLEEMGTGEKKLAHDEDGLVMLSGVAFLEQDLTGLPARILLVPRPVLRFTWNDGEHQVPIDDAAVANVLADFKARGIDMVIDYEHQTLNSTKNGKEAPAAGWIEALEADAAGIWGRLKRWIEPATTYLRTGAYRYISPVIHLDDSGLLRRISSVAITNIPATIQAKPIVLRYDVNPATKDPVKEGNDMEFLQKLALKHGLPETATEAEVNAAIEAATKKAPERVEVVPAGVIKALGLKDTATAAEAEAAARRITDLGIEAVSKADYDNLVKIVSEERFANQFQALKLSGRVTEADRSKFKDAWDAGEQHFKLAVDIVKSRPVISLNQRLAGLVSTDTGKKLEELALKAMEKNPGMGFEVAIHKVCSDNPELAGAYLSEQHAAQPTHGQAAG